MTAPLINSYAVVAYLSGDLARFVDRFRRRYAPECRHRAHITVLPPRALSSPDEAINACREIVSRFQSFDVSIEGVSLFAETQVVKLEIRTGGSALRTLHDILNTGPLEQAENYGYVPHITLSMPIEGACADEILADAQRQWDEFGGSASLYVDTLTFVQQREDETWADLADIVIGRPAGVRA